MKNHVVLCPNPYKDKDFNYTIKAKNILEKAGHEVLVSPVLEYENGFDCPENIQLTPIETAIKGASLLVTLGGDGTILHTVRASRKDSIPIIGVNLGTMGFMAELEPDELELLVDAANGNYKPIKRMMLDVKLIRDGQVLFSDSALNDAVLSGIIRLIHITAFGDGRKIFEFSGDGLIIATPTGSTAYSMSAGGPLVEPTAKNIILTPVCAHVLASRSFVLEPDREVTVKIGELKGKRAVMSVDGSEAIDLMSGDELWTKKSEHYTLMAYMGQKSFYDMTYLKLRERSNQ
jgi:NAD+ kinase